MQTLLNHALPPTRLIVDGVFGIKTDKAVREFQQRNRLTADGIAGPLTAQALGVKYASTAPMPTIRLRPGKSRPRPPFQAPLAALADAILEGLDAFCKAAKQDIRNSGADATVTQKAVDAIDTECFPYISNELKEWANDLKTMTNVEFIVLDLVKLILYFERFVIQVGLFVKEKGHGNTTRLGDRIDSIDTSAIERVVRLTLTGAASEGLDAAVWDLHQILTRAARP